MFYVIVYAVLCCVPGRYGILLCCNFYHIIIIEIDDDVCVMHGYTLK